MRGYKRSSQVFKARDLVLLPNRISSTISILQRIVRIITTTKVGPSYLFMKKCNLRASLKGAEVGD